MVFSLRVLALLSFISFATSGRADIGPGIVQTHPSSESITRPATPQERKQLLHVLQIYFDLLDRGEESVSSLELVQRRLKHLAKNGVDQTIPYSVLNDPGTLSSILAAYRQTVVAELSGMQRLAAAARVVQLILGGPVDQQQPYIVPLPAAEVRVLKTSGVSR